MRKVVGSSSPISEGSSTYTVGNLCWIADDLDKSISRLGTADRVLSSDNEESQKRNSNFDHENIDREEGQDTGWHSDNEVITKDYLSRVTHHAEESGNLDLDRKPDVAVITRVGNDAPSPNFTLVHNNLEDPVGVPPQWAPMNVSVPILNLVDNIFQLKKRDWLRRQVFWISKQILQLVMEDAIDDWHLRQIHWLRREDTIAQGIHWIQDVLWPGGTFFSKVGTSRIISSGSRN